MGRGGASHEGRRVFSAAAWQERLDAVDVRKEDMNALVMNYLVTEGHAAAAETFAQESGTPAGVELGSIAARMAVRAAVAAGDVAGAIERVNDLDPDVLEQRPSLLFALQRQRLIELIRGGDVDAALDFAAEYLAPHAATDAAFLAEVELALSLLVFASPADAPPQLAELLAPAQRAAAAGELNAAILNSQGQESEPRLPRLLKQLLHAQTQARSLRINVAHAQLTLHRISSRSRPRFRPSRTSAPACSTARRPPLRGWTDARIVWFRVIHSSLHPPAKHVRVCVVAAAAQPVAGTRLRRWRPQPQATSHGSHAPHGAAAAAAQAAAGRSARVHATSSPALDAAAIAAARASAAAPSAATLSMRFGLPAPSVAPASTPADAAAATAALTSCGAAPGAASRNSAAAAAASGAAAEVPVAAFVASSDVAHAESTSVPGANTSTHAPPLLNAARASSAEAAPTTRAAPPPPGDAAQASPPALPAATTGNTPAAASAAAARSAARLRPPASDSTATAAPPPALTWRAATQSSPASTRLQDASPAASSTRTGTMAAPLATPKRAPATHAATCVPCPFGSAPPADALPFAPSSATKSAPGSTRPRSSRCDARTPVSST